MQQMPSSMPGSPQFNGQNRLSNSAAQSPLTPNQILNSSMLFPRPSNITPHEWQQLQCMQQQFRQRAPHLNNPLVNELMRNSIAQLSPTTAQMTAMQPNQIRISTPPTSAISSKHGPLPVVPEAPKSNSVNNYTVHFLMSLFRTQTYRTIQDRNRLKSLVCPTTRRKDRGGKMQRM
jgi:hypothetical protein